MKESNLYEQACIRLNQLLNEDKTISAIDKKKAELFLQKIMMEANLIDNQIKAEAVDFVYDILKNKRSIYYVEDAVNGGLFSLKIFLAAFGTVFGFAVLPAFILSLKEKNPVISYMGLAGASLMGIMGVALLCRLSFVPKRPSFFQTPIQQDITDLFGINAKNWSEETGEVEEIKDNDESYLLRNINV